MEAERHFAASRWSFGILSEFVFSVYFVIGCSLLDESRGNVEEPRKVESLRTWRDLVNPLRNKHFRTELVLGLI